MGQYFTVTAVLVYKRGIQKTRSKILVWFRVWVEPDIALITRGWRVSSCPLKKNKIYRISAYRLTRENVRKIIFRYIFVYYNRIKIKTAAHILTIPNSYYSLCLTGSLCTSLGFSPSFGAYHFTIYSVIRNPNPSATDHAVDSRNERGSPKWSESMWFNTNCKLFENYCKILL